MEENENSKKKNLQLVAKIFLIIGCALCLFYVIATAEQIAADNKADRINLPTWLCIFGLLPLAWKVPMTVSYFKKTKNNDEVSIAFKICSLIFADPIAGILMICDNKN